MLKKIMGALGGSLIKDISDAADKFITTDEERLVFESKTQELVFNRFAEIEESAREEMKAKASIIVAEMQSGDNFTKRARPSVVYFGMIVIAINHVLGPWLFVAAGHEIPSIELPSEFWYAWSGIVATWSLGRSVERRGAQNKLTSLINGPNINSPTAKHLLEN